VYIDNFEQVSQTVPREDLDGKNSMKHSTQSFKAYLLRFSIRISLTHAYSTHY